MKRALRRLAEWWYWQMETEGIVRRVERAWLDTLLDLASNERERRQIESIAYASRGGRVWFDVPERWRTYTGTVQR